MWSEDEPVRGGYPDPSLLALSGLDRIRAGLRNQMVPPPISHLFGLMPVAVSPASVTFSMPCSPWLQTDAGVFFAGTAALVADAPLGSAVQVGLGPGQYCVTSELSLNFLRPADVSSGQLIARARPIEVGRTLGLAEAMVEDGQGKLIAHCTTRCFVISLDVPAADGPPPTVEAPIYDTPDPYLRPVPEGAVDPTRWKNRDFKDIIRAQISGESPAPPFAQMLKGVPEASDGAFKVTMPSSQWFTSPAGTIYGGVIAYAADVALSGAFGTIVGDNELAATLDLKVLFLRPALPDGRPLTVTAKVMHRGRTFVTGQAEITNADGKTVAFATSSATIRSGRNWGTLAVADEAVSPTDS
jgi:uncharacterized protein (TIGR00369 family)